MKLQFLCNYDSINNINKYMEKFLINDYHKVKIDQNNPDYYVIINNPYYKNIKQKYNNKKTIYVHNEPLSSHNKWNNWKYKETFLYENKNNWNDWWCNININDLINKKIEKNISKKNTITCITSDLDILDGHKLRMNFLKYLDILPNYNLNSELYGKCKTGIYKKLNLKNYLGEINNRDNALLSYYYNFMGENTREKNYFTEKILDPILYETLCFYWGCPNIKNYLHEKSFIEIDLNKPNIALNIIINSIKNNEYEKRFKYIKETKKKIIYELNPLTLIQNNLIEIS